MYKFFYLNLFVLNVIHYNILSIFIINYKKNYEVVSCVAFNYICAIE